MLASALGQRSRISPYSSPQSPVAVPGVASMVIPLALPEAEVPGRVRVVGFDHATSLASQLCGLYREGKLCDFSFKAQGREFRAHRVVLAASSQEFHKMFTGEMRDRDCDHMEFEEGDVDPKHLEQLLEFVYASEVVVHMDDVVPLLVLADRLSFMTLRQACIDNLLNHMNVDNCIGVVMLGDNWLNCDQLVQVADEFARLHFLEVVETEMWTMVDKDVLIQMLRHDVLRVETEIQVFNAVVRWLQDEKNKPFAFDVLRSCVRFGCIPLAEVAEHVAPTIRTFGDPRCERLLNDVFRQLVLGNGTDGLPKEMMLPRVSNSSLVVIGNINEGTRRLHPCYSYSSLDSAPHAIRFSPEIHDYSGVCCVGNALYVSSRNPEYTSALVYDLPESRMLVGLCNVEGSLYAFGGVKSEHNLLDCVEQYNPQQQRWILRARMPVAGASVSSVTVNNLVYCVAVTALLTGHPKTVLLSYNPRRDAWCNLGDTPIESNAVKVVGAGGDIFVTNAGATGECVVYRYSPQQCSWTQVQSLHNTFARNVFVYNGRLTTCSEKPKERALHTLQLDLRTNRWTRANPLTVPENLRQAKWVVPM